MHLICASLAVEIRICNIFERMGRIFWLILKTFIDVLPFRIYGSKKQHMALVAGRGLSGRRLGKVSLIEKFVNTCKYWRCLLFRGV